jgi:hypothetical protein
MNFILLLFNIIIIIIRYDKHQKNCAIRYNEVKAIVKFNNIKY